MYDYLLHMINDKGKYIWLQHPRYDYEYGEHITCTDIWTVITDNWTLCNCTIDME